MAINIEYFAKTIQTQTEGSSKQWKQAYDWGNHTVSGYITGLIEDKNPQLGGNLDLNSNNIGGSGNVSISGDITAISGMTEATGITNIVSISQNGYDNLAISSGSPGYDPNTLYFIV